MSRPATSSRSHPLSEVASSILCRIPELLRRLRDLESEEAELDTRARQLVEQFPDTKDEPSVTLHSTISTPISKLRSRATGTDVDDGITSTPLHTDPGNIETPVKAFLLMESFSLAMSLKGKRRGRIFIGGDSSEFGERR